MTGEKPTDRHQWQELLAARQVAEALHLRRQADRATQPEEACLLWLGLLRLVRRRRRALDTRRPSPDTDDHLATLWEVGREAQCALDAADPVTVGRARRRLGIRVAIVGKGGTGRSAIAATMARLLARRGRSVLAADFDTNPGLAYSLGAPATAGTLDAVVAEQPGAPYGWGLASGDSVEVVERHAATAPDGVRFLSLGKIAAADAGAPKRTVAALCELVAGFGEPDWDVIGDLEAGPTTVFERYHRFADRALVVATPTWVSQMTARRLQRVLDDVPSDMVANQLPEDGLLGGPALLGIPYDRRVAEAERRGSAPLGECPDSPMVAAVAQLVDTLIDQKVPA